jgi:hypothetical protein
MNKGMSLLIESSIGRAPVAEFKMDYQSYASSTWEAPNDPEREEEEHLVPTRVTSAAQEKAKTEDMTEFHENEDLSAADISSNVYVAPKNETCEGGDGPLATNVCSTKDEPRGFVYHQPPQASHAFL